MISLLSMTKQTSERCTHCHNALWSYVVSGVEFRRSAPMKICRFCDQGQLHVKFTPERASE